MQLSVPRPMKDILAASVTTSVMIILIFRFGKKALHFIVIRLKNEVQFIN